MQRELPQYSNSRDLPAARLRRSLYLFHRDLRAKVEPDGSSSWVHSAPEGKLLFGREATEVFKLQSGVRIAVKAPETLVKATPTCAYFTPRGQDKVQAAHSFRLVAGESTGSTRVVRVVNKGDSMAKLRVLTLHDPTSLNYRRDKDPPGEIGVNAFNRHDQVVMDDVGDTAGVRVIGFSPRPSVIFMTKDRGRAAELLSLGELPESSLGMSGSVIVLTQHDLDVQPGASVEVRSVSVYHTSSLEAALSASSVLISQGDHEAKEPARVEFSSSSASTNFAFEWARAALNAIEGEANLAERLWCGVALSLVRGDHFEKLVDPARQTMRKDGTLPYSERSKCAEQKERPGPTETSLYLIGVSAFLSERVGDKKLVKKWYPQVRKAAEGIVGLLHDGLVAASPDSPDGWRRRLGAGFPSGSTAEVNLLAVRALRDASTVAFLAGKGSDSGRFRELSVRLLNGLNQRLRDSESGALALNLDGRGVVHRELTVDQAVALSYCSPDQNVASSVVHRMLEKDFETGYGPRTVAASNNLYYSSSYADGQLGGYWTRAALSHALLAFSTGYPAIASAQLEKVSRLVHTECERLGGIPGEFPYWIDTERGQVAGTGSDTVAAARFVEAVLFGEGGLSLGSQGARFKVPEASQLRWFFVHRLDLGRPGSIFVGRSPGRSFVASSFDQGATEGTALTVASFVDCERVWGPAGVEGLVFFDANSALVCVGNAGVSTLAGVLSFPLKSKSFSSALFAQVEELQQDTGLWRSLERVKLRESLELQVDLKAASWKSIRVSTLGR